MRTFMFVVLLTTAAFAQPQQPPVDPAKQLQRYRQAAAAAEFEAASCALSSADLQDRIKALEAEIGKLKPADK